MQYITNRMQYIITGHTTAKHNARYIYNICISSAKQNYYIISSKQNKTYPNKMHAIYILSAQIIYWHAKNTHIVYIMYISQC